MAKSRVTIVGTGLVGGSIGLALKKSRIELEVIGHDKDTSAASRAQKRGAVDSTKWNLIDACQGAGLIILAIPLDGIKSTLDALKPHLQPGVILTDTATTKAPVLEWASQLGAGIHYIGGNPILKRERANGVHGIDGADADLFRGAIYCLMPATNAAPDAIETMSNFVSLLGAKPYFIDAVEHDGLMAGTRHWPVLRARALAAATMDSPSWRERSKLASADFRAATNLAPTNPQAGREELMAHREALIAWTDTLVDKLTELRGMLERQDAAALESLMEKIASQRAKWLSGASTEDSVPVDWEAAQFNVSRLFIGGLADRGKKLKPKGRG
jgi:prephenate dehydrogenase